MLDCNSMIRGIPASSKINYTQINQPRNVSYSSHRALPLPRERFRGGSGGETGHRSQLHGAEVLLHAGGTNAPTPTQPTPHACAKVDCHHRSPQEEAPATDAPPEPAYDDEERLGDNQPKAKGGGVDPKIVAPAVLILAAGAFFANGGSLPGS